MKIVKTLATAVGLSALTLSCMAQEDDEATNYIYSSYYYCGGGPLATIPGAGGSVSVITRQVRWKARLTVLMRYRLHSQQRTMATTMMPMTIK
jgi:hypothetical protein